MKTSQIPRNFDWPHNDPGRLRAGMQGQTFVTVLDHETLPGTALSKLLILMTPGKVSNVHVHHATDVYIDVITAGVQGVLTLAGDELEHAVWTSSYQSLWLPPGVPHVAVYPLPEPDTNVGDDPGPDLHALETRTSSVADADVWALEGYGPLLVRRLGGLGLLHRVTPSLAMLGQEPVAGSSCFPTSPGAVIP